MSTRVVRLALAGGSLLLALTVVEIAVRLFSPAPPLMYVPHPTLGWVHPPGSEFQYDGNSGTIRVRFSEKGLRGEDIPYEKPPGVYRILVLGDSYPEGVDVPEDAIFTSRLERRFRAAGCAVEVINTGVGGYGTDQEALFLSAEGWRYSPDLVLMTFTIDNDVSDNTSKGYCRLTPDGVECTPPAGASPWREFVTASKAFLQAHWHTYFFVREKGSQVAIVRRVVEGLGLTEVSSASAVDVAMPLSLFLREEPAEVADGWALTRGILASIVGDVRRRGADAALVLVPALVQLDDAAFEVAVGRAAGTAAEFDLERPNRLLRGFGAAHALPVIDVLAEFRRRPASGEVLVDGHWNVRGHDVVGAEIEAALRKRIQGKLGC